MLRKVRILNLIIQNSVFIAFNTKIQDHATPFTMRKFALKTKPNGLQIREQFQKCKKVMKRYWYIVLPVYVLNTAIWFGCCYYITEEGFDVIKYLEKADVKQEIIDFLTHSEMGQLTVTFALFKLLTPLRFATILMSSTAAIYYCKKLGLIQLTKSASKIKQK